MTGPKVVATTYIFRRWNRLGRKGQRCKVTTRSPTNGNMRIEFRDGFVVIAPRHAVAKIPPSERTLF